MKTLPAITALLLFSSPLSRAITIDIGFAPGFFFDNLTAQDAIRAAAADINAAILPSLGAVPTDEFKGVNGMSTATFDWELSYQNPMTGSLVTEGTFTFAADEIRILVGGRALSGTSLGVGGPASAGLSAGISGFASEFPLAVANAEANSNAVMPRGCGPVMASFSDTLGGTPYTVTAGAMLGATTFDADTNNDNILDDAATLEAFWHYDHTTAVATGKNDLYSVALHEILHAIGFGTSTTWNLLKSGVNWNGTHVIGLLGSGANLISADGGHIADSFTSPRLSDGVLQEVAMDPSITVGTRKSLTQLDVAFLRDLNYKTVPEPATAALLLGGALVLAGRREKSRRP